MELKYESDYVPDFLIETVEDPSKNSAIPDKDICWFDALPDEVIYQIFGNLTPSILGSVVQHVCMRWHTIATDFSLFAQLSQQELDKLYLILPEIVVDQFILTASYEDLLSRRFCSHTNEARWERLCTQKMIPEDEMESNNNNDKNTLRKNAKVTWKQFFIEYVRKNPPICEFCRRQWINSLLHAGIKMKMKGRNFHSICWMCKKILDPFHPGHIPSFVTTTVEAVRTCPECIHEWEILAFSQAIPGNLSSVLGMCETHSARVTSDIQRLHPRTSDAHGSLCRHTDEWWSKYWKDPKMAWFPDSIKQDKFEKMMKQQAAKQAMLDEKEKRKKEREAKKLVAAESKHKERRPKEPRTQKEGRRTSNSEQEGLEESMMETESLQDQLSVDNQDDMETSSTTSQLSEEGSETNRGSLRNKRKEPRTKEERERRKKEVQSRRKNKEDSMNGQEETNSTEIPNEAMQEEVGTEANTNNNHTEERRERRTKEKRERNNEERPRRRKNAEATSNEASNNNNNNQENGSNDMEESKSSEEPSSSTNEKNSLRRTKKDPKPEPRPHKPENQKH